MRTYYINNGKENGGPFTLEELKSQQINKATLVWYQGMDEWKHAHDIEELSSFFTVVPPPIKFTTPTPETISTPKIEDEKESESTILGLKKSHFFLALLFLAIFTAVVVLNVIQNNKAVSAYQLIGKLRPVLLGWANYSKFVECKETFSKVDNIVFQQLRAWVFRRAVRQGRKEVKEKYFPSNNIYKFDGRDYKANWILTGSKASKNKQITIHLPKLSWVKSSKYVKVKGNASVYDGNEVYWSLRTPRYSILSTRVKNLLLRQRGKCQICSKTFREGDVMEVDHITPRSRGGEDIYSNLQLLHRQCHVNKTKKDRI